MKRILALDYGTVRIGMAVSDPTGTLATELPFLQATKPKEWEQELKKRVASYELSEVLVGLPRNMDGSEGPSALAAREFAAKVEVILGVPVRLIDERLSTVQAGRMLQEAGLNTRKQKSKIDSAAARVMLQQILDSRAWEI